MARPLLLDLACGAGGAAMGYHRAGFDAIGVDIEPQAALPVRVPPGRRDEHHAFDGALAKLFGDLWRPASYAAIHASPPCQFFTQMRASWRAQGVNDGPRRPAHADAGTHAQAGHAVGGGERCRLAGKAMNATLMRHGGMFGMGIHRPRLFESQSSCSPPARR